MATKNSSMSTNFIVVVIFHSWGNFGKHKLTRPIQTKHYNGILININDISFQLQYQFDK